MGEGTVQSTTSLSFSLCSTWNGGGNQDEGWTIYTEQIKVVYEIGVKPVLASSVNTRFYEKMSCSVGLGTEFRVLLEMSVYIRLDFLF